MVKYLSILRDTDNLFKEVESYLRIHESSVMPDSSYNRFICRLAELLGGSESNMFISCLSVKESPLTKSSLYSLLWRLTANRGRLLHGYPVLYYPKYAFSDIEEIKFESVVNKNGKYHTVIRVITGPYAFGTFSCKFSEMGMGFILSKCGYDGRTYKIGRKELCLSGLLGKAQLTNYAENPRIFEEIIPNDDIIAFNRKHIISLREGRASCPFNLGGRCPTCKEFSRNCLASYKEFKYYD